VSEDSSKRSCPRTSLAVEPPSGEIVDGLRSLDDGYVPPIFIDNNGEELLDRKIIVRRVSRSSGRGDSANSASSLHLVGAASGAVKCARTIPT